MLRKGNSLAPYQNTYPCRHCLQLADTAMRKAIALPEGSNRDRWTVYACELFQIAYTHNLAGCRNPVTQLTAS